MAFINTASFSKLDCYRQCPYKFELKYLKRIKDPDQTDMSAAEFGSYIHKIFEDGVNKPLEDLQDLAKHHRYTYKFSGKYNDNLTQKCLNNFIKLNERLSETIGTETQYEVPVCEEHKMTHNGIIDRVVRGSEGGILVIDYKTGKREKSKIDLFNDDQLKGYAYASHKLYGVPYNKIHCALYYPITDNLVSIQYTELQIRHFINNLINKIWEIRKKKSGQFPAIKNNFCNYCSYQSLCPKYRTEGQIKQRLDEITKLKTQPQGKKS